MQNKKKKNLQFNGRLSHRAINSYAKTNISNIYQENKKT